MRYRKGHARERLLLRCSFVRVIFCYNKLGSHVGRWANLLPMNEKKETKWSLDQPEMRYGKGYARGRFCCSAVFVVIFCYNKLRRHVGRCTDLLPVRTTHKKGDEMVSDST